MFMSLCCCIQSVAGQALACFPGKDCASANLQVITCTVPRHQVLSFCIACAAISAATACGRGRCCKPGQHSFSCASAAGVGPAGGERHRCEATSVGIGQGQCCSRRLPDSFPAEPLLQPLGVPQVCTATAPPLARGCDRATCAMPTLVIATGNSGRSIHAYLGTSLAAHTGLEVVCADNPNNALRLSAAHAAMASQWRTST